MHKVGEFNKGGLGKTCVFSEKSSCCALNDANCLGHHFIRMHFIRRNLHKYARRRDSASSSTTNGLSGEEEEEGSSRAT